MARRSGSLPHLPGPCNPPPPNHYISGSSNTQFWFYPSLLLAEDVQWLSPRLFVRHPRPFMTRSPPAFPLRSSAHHVSRTACCSSPLCLCVLSSLLDHSRAGLLISPPLSRLSLSEIFPNHPGEPSPPSALGSQPCGYPCWGMHQTVLGLITYR